MTADEQGLRVLADRTVKSHLMEDAILGEGLIPRLHQADGFDRILRPFGGQACWHRAPGLVSFISRGESAMRSLVRGA